MKLSSLVLLVILSFNVHSQSERLIPEQLISLEESEGYPIRKVSISIDDVPNVRIIDPVQQHSSLLDQLDAKEIPVSIFINEGLIYQGDTASNIELLESWIKNKFVTCGNHTFGHSRYSTSGIDHFIKDIEKGQLLSDSILKIYNKEITYFRFPYNDLGHDSVQHEAIKTYLTNNEFTIAPFTIESSDWMFNFVYLHYLNKGDSIKAQEIGQQYIRETLELFNFYDSLSVAQYQRHIDQVYLCHDNQLNTDYLLQLIKELESQQYSFISFEEALNDDVYKQDDVYYKKWGVSWFYRWMNDANTRKSAMQAEPQLQEIYELYNAILESEKN